MRRHRILCEYGAHLRQTKCKQLPRHFDGREDLLPITQSMVVSRLRWETELVVKTE